MKCEFAATLAVTPFRQAGLSRILRGLTMGLSALVMAGALSTPAAAQGAAQSAKIGFVNTERILRDSAPAKTAQTKIEAEFKTRDSELQRMASNLRSLAEKYDKDAPVLSESERTRRQRELFNLDTDLQRKRSEFQEDFNRRRNEEFSALVDKANGVIKSIAERENYDLIIQDAVTVNPRVDITDRVIQALGK